VPLARPRVAGHPPARPRGGRGDAQVRGKELLAARVRRQDRIAHRLSVAFTPLDDTLGLGGVRILWHRQISPPPATPTFGDVPPSDAFFPHVEALAASFITGGCSGGNYCPNAPLTRAQMAVFLAKALGLHWPQ